MVRRNCLAGLFFILMVVLILAGCSSSSTSDGKITGDPNSAEFQNMKAAIATTVDSTLASSFRFYAQPDKFPQDSVNLRFNLGVLNPEDTVLYNYLNGWNILYVGLTTGLSYDHLAVDSVRFKDSRDQALRYFDTRVVATDFIHHGANTYKGTGNTYKNLSSWVSLGFSGVGTTTPQVSGMGTATLDDYQMSGMSQKHDQYNWSMTLNQIKFTRDADQSWTGTMVTGGTATLNGTMTSGMTNQSWSVNLAFAGNGQVQVVATIGNMQYSYSWTPSFQ